MIDLNQVKVTPRDQQVLNLLVQGCSNKEIAGPTQYQPTNGETASAHVVPAGRHSRRTKARQTRHRHV